MHSFTAGQYPSELAAGLLQGLQKSRCGDVHWKYFAGVSYRNLLIWRSRGEEAPFSRDTISTPPHDITGQLVEGYLPTGPGSELLRGLMEESRGCLERPRPIGSGCRRGPGCHSDMALGTGAASGTAAV